MNCHILKCFSPPRASVLAFLPIKSVFRECTLSWILVQRIEIPFVGAYLHGSLETHTPQLPVTGHSPFGCMWSQPVLLGVARIGLGSCPLHLLPGPGVSLTFLAGGFKACSPVCRACPLSWLLLSFPSDLNLLASCQVGEVSWQARWVKLCFSLLRVSSQNTSDGVAWSTEIYFHALPEAGSPHHGAGRVGFS